MNRIRSIEAVSKLLVTLSNNQNIRVIGNDSTYQVVSQNNSTKNLVYLHKQPGDDTIDVKLSKPSLDNIDSLSAEIYMAASILQPDYADLLMETNRPGVSDGEYIIYSILLQNLASRSIVGKYTGLDKSVALFWSNKIKNVSRLPEDSIITQVIRWDLWTKGTYFHPDLLIGLHSNLKKPQGLPENLEEELMQVKTSEDLLALTRKIINPLESPQDNSNASNGDDEGNNEDSNSNQDGPSENNNNNSSSANNKPDGDNQSNIKDSGSNNCDSDAIDKQPDPNSNTAGENKCVSGDTPSIGNPINLQQNVKYAVKELYGAGIINNNMVGMDSLQKTRLRYDLDYIPNPGPYIVTMEDIQKKGVNLKQKNSILQIASKSVVSRKIHRKLLVLNQIRYESNLKRGRLDNKKLYKLRTSTTNTIFKKRQNPQIDKDAAVQLIIDCSGSMFTKKQRYLYAAAAAYCMAETLKSLGISYEILGFTAMSHSMPIYEFKPFGVQMKQTDLIDQFATQLMHSGNSDGDTLLIASERLLLQPEKKKIMVVLSDGYPAGHYVGDGRVYLKQVCQEIESSGLIDLYGIGILSGAVEHFYKHYSVLQEESQLDSILLKLISDKIIIK